jgi:uncharacterized membrane protein YfcA
VTVAFIVTLAGLGLLGAFVSGLLGVGGAIVMIPLLLYGPPLLGVGHLDARAVTGITIAQVFVAAVSGMLAHRRQRLVHADLAFWGGLSMAAGSLAGALASNAVSARTLLLTFALMATVAAGLMLLPNSLLEGPPPMATAAPRLRFSRVRTVIVSGTVGVAAGLVGAGGAFLLVPLLLVVVGVPIRVTIGSSLAITAVSSMAGFAGKMATGQVPYAAAMAVAVGAVPGAQLGAALSRRLPGDRLKLLLFAVIAVSAARVWLDVLTP